MITTKVTNQLRKGFTGSTLKIIAIAAMFIDHIGATILQKGILKDLFLLPESEFFAVLQTPPSLHAWYIVFYICRAVIGRIAFPLFCFLLIEGFLHTKDIKKYAIRLLAFAFISEIPFDFAIRGKILEFNGQNIFFTLFIGLLILIALEKLKKKLLKPQLMQMNVVILGMIVAFFLKTDYGAMGVLLIAILYLFKDNKQYRLLLSAGLLIITGNPLGILAFVPTQFYNGQRGLESKYAFYIFYPLHLLLLGSILYFLF